MRLSQSVTYAIHAVLRLAARPDAGPISCGKLAREGGMPERFLLQILRDLSKKGILQSARGGGGGFVLDRRPEDITLLEVIEAVEGPLCPSLPLRGNFPAGAGDHLHAALARISDETRRQLWQVRVSDLLRLPPSIGDSPEGPAGVP